MIPVCEPLAGGKELDYVTDCIRENWISSAGKYISRFEEGFSAYCGAKYGIATTSGTTALHLALAALGVGRGDEVILPTFTMAACAFAVLYTGARPVLVDSEPEAWNIDVREIEKKITPRTKAILPVHLYGHPCDMDPILSIARKHGLFVVEDAAEAHGAAYQGRMVGGIGDVGCFSFYANKIITTGEGGMVVTSDEKVAERARRLKDQAFSRERRFLHTELGFNYRMTNIQAAIGLAQLEQIERFVETRRRHAFLYSDLLRGTPGLTLPGEKSWAKNVYWMYAVLIEDPFGMSRDGLMAFLRDRGVDTRTLFIPMHVQPVFRDAGLFEVESYPVSERLAARGLYLPSGTGLTEGQIFNVCEAIHQARNQQEDRYENRFDDPVECSLGTVVPR
jgi:perosamine synthetase